MGTPKWHLLSPTIRYRRPPSSLARMKIFLAVLTGLAATANTNSHQHILPGLLLPNTNMRILPSPSYYIVPSPVQAKVQTLDASGRLECVNNWNRRVPCAHATHPIPSDKIVRNQSPSGRDSNCCWKVRPAFVGTHNHEYDWIFGLDQDYTMDNGLVNNHHHYTSADGDFALWRNGHTWIIGHAKNRGSANGLVTNYKLFGRSCPAPILFGWMIGPFAETSLEVLCV